MKNYKIIAVLLVMGLIFSGCNMIEVNEERDMQTVIAKVGDEVVTKGDFQEIFSMYEMYGQVSSDWKDDSTYGSYYDTIVTALIDQLVDDKVQVCKAKELGLYELSDEDSAEVLEQVNSLLDSYISMYQSELSMEDEYADTDEEQLKQIASDNIDDYLVNYGITKDELINEYTDQLVLDKLYETTTASIEVSEDEVKAKYDEEVEAQMVGFDEGTMSYESVASGTDTVYYTPEGVRQAQHILIMISDEDSEKISELTDSGDTEGADAAKLEALEAIKPQADDAYNRAIAGEDFVQLMEELGEDTGMDSKDYYLVIEETQQYVSEFAEGLFALDSIGDISEPVASDYGYHIIKYYGDELSGAVNYDNVSDDLYDGLLSDKQNEYFSEELTKWKESLDINVKYDKILD